MASSLSSSDALDNSYGGNLFMVVAPSGAGKSTLVNALLAREANIQLSVSYTTRAPRPGEQSGREYHFVGVDEFQRRRAAGEFIESAEVHGNYYATSRVWIEERVRSGIDVLLEIGWQGARQVKTQFPHGVGIFILPPSIEALEARLKKRGQDAPATIERRLLAARSEIEHAPDSTTSSSTRFRPCTVATAGDCDRHAAAVQHADVRHREFSRIRDQIAPI